MLDKQSIKIEEMLKNNKLLQPALLSGSLESDLNNILTKQDVPMLDGLLEESKRAQRAVLWEMLRVTLNICLKDKNEIAKYKSRGLN